MDEIFGFSILVIWFTAIVGWCMNIYKFIELLGGEVTTWFIARAVGIFIAPFGAALGFF